jgi:hypothetical protein
MGLLSGLRSVYDLDTLDTRFTTPASVPYKAVLEARSQRRGNGEYNDGLLQQQNGSHGWEAKPDKRAQPSKWNTPEFYIYYVAFVTLVPYMFWIAYDVSRRKCSCKASNRSQELGEITARSWGQSWADLYAWRQHRIRGTASLRASWRMAGYLGARLYDIPSASWIQDRRRELTVIGRTTQTRSTMAFDRTHHT